MVPHPTPPKPGTVAAPAWGLSWPLLAAAQLAWIPSATFLIVLFAFALAPAYLLAAQALAHVPTGAPDFVVGLVWGLVLPVAYAAFAILFPALVALGRLAVGARSREGSDSVTSPRMLAWYHQLLSTYAVVTLCGPFLRATGLSKWFARGMGMKVGHGAMLNSLKIYDMDLIEVGDRAVIGGDAVITGHVVEAGRLVRRRVRIGAGATIGLHAVLLPGVTVGANAQVGALALVGKDAILEPGSVYAGVPARRVR